MPTLKPRITITVSDHAFEVLSRMAKLQGCSKGKVIADLLEAVSPALTRTVALLEAAADAPQQVRDGLRSVVEKTHDELLETTGDSIQQLDFLLGAFSDAEQGVNPHVVTRGSGMVESRGSATAQKASKPLKSRAAAKSAARKS